MQQQISINMPDCRVFSIQQVEGMCPDIIRFYKSYLCSSLPRMDDFDRLRVYVFKIRPDSKLICPNARQTVGVKAIAISLPPQFEGHLEALALQMPWLDFTYSECCRDIHRRLYWAPSKEAMLSGCFEFAIPFLSIRVKTDNGSHANAVTKPRPKAAV